MSVLRILIFAACLLGGLAQASAERGYAIVVGIDDYASEEFPTLRNAENDARAMAQYFRSQGYEVSLLLGSEGTARKADLSSTVRTLAAGLRDDDRVVLFFAGHGTTEIRDGIKLGYFVMTPEPGAERANLVSSGDMLRYGRMLDTARHQLFIFDFCYSALLGRLPTRSGTKKQVFSDRRLQEAMGSRRARQFLSAGGDNQEVLDSGPGGLSWFTYFLLKGLEPGVINDRDSGLVIFTELAAYVKVNAANLYHTPADGSMIGHQGGDFLLFQTDRGRPPLEPRPDIGRQVLADLGFITRGEPAKVQASLEDMQGPIDRLYQAWTTLDSGLYLEQLHPDIVQTILYKSGRRVARGFAEIAAQRPRQFQRFARVDVLNYEVMYQGGDETEATFGVRYSMDFHHKDGRPAIREHNVKECYKVRFNETVGRWQIIRNDDYQQRICAYD